MTTQGRTTTKRVLEELGLLRHEIVAKHLETFLAEAREIHERALPQYVERELRVYLKCGILAHCFLRARRPLVRQGFARCTVLQAAGRVPILQYPTQVWDRRTFDGARGF